MNATEMYDLQEVVQEVKNHDDYLGNGFNYPDGQIEAAVLDMTDATLIGEDSGNNYFLYDDGDVDMIVDNVEGYVLKEKRESGEKMVGENPINQAISLIEEAMNLVNDAVKGSNKQSHYEAYGRYGFNQLLGNGNPYDSSLFDLMKEDE